MNKRQRNKRDERIRIMAALPFLTQKEIAQAVGCSQETVSRVLAQTKENEGGAYDQTR